MTPEITPTDLKPMPSVTLVGYGNQGRAWAANLRDAGWDVLVCSRAQHAQKDAFDTISYAELATRHRGPVALLLPDDVIPDFFRQYLSQARPKIDFVFAHGYAVVHGQIPFQAEDGIFLCAPKGIGQKLRENFVAGSGVMGVVGRRNAVDNTLPLALARGLGCDRIGIVETDFETETIADLFSEQVLLTGTLPHLLQKSVAFMIAKGIPPRLAVYECLHEMKLIVDMMVQYGVKGTLARVSRTALYGGLESAEVLLPRAHLERSMDRIWNEIENGLFAKNLDQELKSQQPKITELMRSLENNPVDQNL